LFWFDLPLHPQDKLQQHLSWDQEKVYPFIKFKRKLLLVEDDPLGRKDVKAKLAKQKFEVVMASTLKEAKALLQQQLFSSVIVDYRLPDGLGSDLVNFLQQRALKSKASHIRSVFMLSANMEEDLDAQQREEARYVTSWLSKPFDVDLFIKKVARRDLAVLNDRHFFEPLKPEDSKSLALFDKIPEHFMSDKDNVIHSLQSGWEDIEFELEQGFHAELRESLHQFKGVVMILNLQMLMNDIRFLEMASHQIATDAKRFENHFEFTSYKVKYIIGYLNHSKSSS
jgi:response regulator RpfG family c-di-GMP phosphodiesterase